MPNWVYSFIEVDEKHLPLVEKIVERGGLCRHYMPMPSDIEKTMSPNRIITEEEYAERVANGTTTETLDGRFGQVHYNTQAQVNDFTQRYGAPDWYGWANINWGTKWGDVEHEISQNNGFAMLRFESAWSPLSGAVLDKFFADVVQADYIWEEEQGFGQKYSVRDGEATLVDEWDEPRWNRGDDQK